MLVWLAPVLVFGLVIFVHEFGHFIAAKAVGVYAPRFSIGFGPALWRWRPGETEYVIAVLPIGGYVRMASRYDETAALLEGGSEESSRIKPGEPGYDPDAMIPFGPRPVPENRWFESKPLPARLLILFAGVAMNAVLALVLATGLMAHFGRTVIPTRVVGAVHAPAQAPELAQLHPGDTVFAVNGDTVRDWTDVLTDIGFSTDRVVFTTQRGTVTVPLSDSVHAEDVAEAIDYRTPAIADSVVAGGAAAAGGMQAGDTIVAVDGHPIPGFNALVDLVSPAVDSPLVFEVRRAGRVVDLHITPRATQVRDSATGKTETVGRIGIARRALVQRVPLSIGEAVVDATRLTVGMVTSVAGYVWSLVVHKASVSELGGPIAITRASVDAARMGLANLFYLIAFLSINVGVLNLLPIPILDGGNIVINVIETVRGTPFSIRTRENILRAGLAVIAVIFAVAMFNDVRAWLGRFLG